ncbi:hypothetical protein JCM10212_007059 [Sporobolomyces blumeae]
MAPRRPDSAPRPPAPSSTSAAPGSTSAAPASPSSARRPRSRPRPRPQPATARADDDDLPESFTQLKYVLFSWTHSPVTKRDPLARAYFAERVHIKTFVETLGGFPITLYEGNLGPNRATELFLGSDHCRVLVDGLAESMGPTRAESTWKRDAVHSQVDLAKGSNTGGVVKRTFETQAQLEARFAELKLENDRYESRHHRQALERARTVVEWIANDPNRVEARFVAVDVETYEMDHDIVTEVGFAKSTLRGDRFEPMETRHFVVEENAKYRNGKYCPDARDHFHFGSTETLSTERVVSFLRTELLVPSTPVFLLLHDHRSDLKSLQLLGLSTASFVQSPTLPLPTHPDAGSMYRSGSESGKWILDTQHLYSGWKRQKKQARLETACKELGISLHDDENGVRDAVASTRGRGGSSGSRLHELEMGGYDAKARARHLDDVTIVGREGRDADGSLAFHNSGNDAWATLLVFWKLIAGVGETDAQETS